MAIIMVPENREHEFLHEFYKNSYLTFEGINLTNKLINHQLEDFIRKHGYNEKDFILYWFKGTVMNNVFNLTDENAYNDNLIFGVVPNYFNPRAKVALKARWFSDIVDNNSIKQRAIDCGIEPDFDYSKNSEDEDEQEFE